MIGARTFTRGGLSRSGWRSYAASGELGNGVMTASVAFNGPVASVGVFSDLGSRSETPETNGVLKVVMTAKVAEASAKIAALGGAVTGEVSRDGTKYVASVLAADAAAAAEILAGCVGGAPEAGAFAAAQEACLAEVGAHDMVEEVHACAYLDAAYGMPVGGTAASVGALTHADAEAAVTVPTTFKVAGAGACDFGAFGTLPGGAEGLVPYEATAAHFTGSDKKTSYDAGQDCSTSLQHECS